MTSHVVHLAMFVLVVALSSSAHAQTLVVANKAEASVSLIDLPSGEVRATLPTGVGPHEVAVAPEGRIAVITDYGQQSGGNTLTVIDIVEAKVVKTIELGEYGRPHGVEWLDPHQVAVTAEARQALIVVDVFEGEVVKAIGTDQQVSHMVTLDGARPRAYVTNIGSGSLTVLDLSEGKRVANIETGDGAEGIAWVAGADQIWVTNRGADTLTVFDAATLEKRAEIDSGGFPIRATATPRGKVLVTRARASDVVIYDASSLQEERVVSFDLESLDVEQRLFGDRFGNSSVPIGVVIDSEGERAYIAHANADVITEIEVSTGKLLRTLRAGKEPDGMSYSPLSVKN